MSSKSPDMMRSFFILAVLAVSLLIIATYLLSMGLGILVFFSTTEGLQFSREQLFLKPLLFIDVDVSVNAGFYFIFLWWVFILCFAAALKYRESIFGRVRETLSGTAKRSLFKNNLLAMPVITSMLLVAVLALHFLQTLGGIPTGEPAQHEPFLDFLRFSRAPVDEEIIFRIIPMGAFLITYVPLAGKKVTQTLSSNQRLKLGILSILQPDKAKEMVGLKTINEHGLFGGTIWAEWMMVVFTALLFGVAHYTGGWQIGKISQAALSGAVFAGAYLYYGVQAPILLHWFFNYYFSAFELTHNYLAMTDLASLTWLTSISFGIFLWLTTLMFGSIVLYKKLRKKPKPKPLLPSIPA